MSSAAFSFQEASAGYDESRQVPGEVLGGLGRLVATHGRGPWLDLGTGTGRAARAASSAGCRVVGLDVADAMLARLRAMDPDRRIPLVRADFRAFPFGAGAFAGALAYHVLHLTTEPEALLERLRAVLVPGAPLLWLTDLPAAPGLYGRLKTRYAELVAGRCPFGKPASTDAAFVERAVAALGGRSEEIAAPELAWERVLRTDDLLELFRAKSYSVLFAVPGPIHEDVMARLLPWGRSELPESERMPFRIRACRVTFGDACERTS